MINFIHNVHLNKVMEQFKKTHLIEKFNESSIFVKLIVIYIIYSLSKKLITGIISIILYVVLIVITIYYTYDYIDKK